MYSPLNSYLCVHWILDFKQLLLLLLYMEYVCFMSDVVTMWGLWECALCSDGVKDSGFLSLKVLKK